MNLESLERIGEVNVSTLALNRRYTPVHRIDGGWFARLVTAGARWVCAHREELNRINVFPVVDGDTGTNMSATLRAVARSIQRNTVGTLAATAKSAAEGCLMGARGNSGMILCHIFSSLAAGVGEQESLEPRELARILRTASADLYRALETPVEGTILTVLRDSTAHTGLDECQDLEELITLLVREARAALDRTPDQLAALKAAQVVDSGALGYVYFLEGMLREVQGQPLPQLGEEVAPSKIVRPRVHEESPHFRFCTEVVVESRSPLTTGHLRKMFRAHGDSLIPLLTGRLAKIHIHTNSPEEVFNVAATVGTVVRTKVEDMRTQSQGMFGHDGQPAEGVKLRTRIVCDSTCDLPTEVLSKWGIQMVPLKVMFGDEAMKDRVEILPDEFIQRMITSPVHPCTSQPAPDDFAQAYGRQEAAMEGEEEILCLTLSSKLSGTFNSAKLASDVKSSVKVHLFDVPFASAPYGLLVTRAAELARQGLTASEIVADLERLKKQTNILFALDTLEYMKRGGRISWGQAFLGNLLDLKPILEFQDGKMVPHAKVRSKEKARQRVLDDLRTLIPKDKPVRFMLVHSGRPDQLLPVENFLNANFQVSHMMNCNCGAVIAAHCGPGAWGVAWMVE